MSVTDVEARRFDSDKVLAMVNYGLLFSAVFFAGVPGIVAVVIAYAQKPTAGPVLRGHYRFQIQIFWIAFLLGMIAGICGLWALLDVAGQVWGNGHVAVSDADGVDLDLADLDLTGRLIGLTIASLVAAGAACLWSLAAPAIGFIRLATAPA